ncbi:MAG: alcohol dehydrogenase catalytic domain-containing protein [Candidatus Dormiibacterota bacterium]
MRAVLFTGDGVVVDEVPSPSLSEPGDALVRVTTTAICGSDLHVIHGRIPGMSPGSVLGHEFVGVVEAVSPEVKRFRPGDRVLGSFTVPCGECWYCGRRLFSRCIEQRVFGYGAFFGDLAGAQADCVRVPNADLALHVLEPQLGDEQALFAGDIFTTGLEVAAEGRIEAGDTVAVIGCGPVGLMAIQAAAAYRPDLILGVDTVAARLGMARTLGAEPVDAAGVNVPTLVHERTGDRGADVVLECVGSVPALNTALDSVRRGGRISVIGVHADPEWTVELNIVFVKAVDIKFCGTANIVGRWDRALELIREGVADPRAIISHRLPLEEAVRGYELFESRQALKVVLTP